MGMIEKYWDDITVYYVEFTAGNKEGKAKKFGRALAFDSEVSKEEVSRLVKSRLNNIIEVTVIDELFTGLMLKKRKVVNY